MTVRIGCSGWSYTHWRGRFYPATLPARAWFGWYARQFDTVELNATFYRMPTAAAVAQWAAQAPPGFVYAAKVHRYLTHMCKLRGGPEPLARVLTALAPLGAHLGPLLHQLPPHWRCDRARLADYLALLPRAPRQVIEFRDPTWYTDAVFALLAEHDVALCVHDMPDAAAPRIAVGPIVYLRLHGGRGHNGAYAPATLAAWARWLGDVAADRAAWVYFNNDVDGHAIRNAQSLRRRLEGDQGKKIGRGGGEDTKSRDRF